LNPPPEADKVDPYKDEQLDKIQAKLIEDYKKRYEKKKNEELGILLQHEDPPE